MTGAEFKAALETLRWTHMRATHELGLSLRTVTRYAAGETPVPRTVAIVLRAALGRRRK